MTNSEKLDGASVICEKLNAKLIGEIYIPIEGFLRTQKGKETRDERRAEDRQNTTRRPG
jgi:hypothetical protein